MKLSEKPCEDREKQKMSSRRRVNQRKKSLTSTTKKSNQITQSSKSDTIQTVITSEGRRRTASRFMEMERLVEMGHSEPVVGRKAPDRHQRLTEAHQIHPHVEKRQSETEK